MGMTYVQKQRLRDRLVEIDRIDAFESWSGKGWIRSPDSTEERVQTLEKQNEALLQLLKELIDEL